MEDGVKRSLVVGLDSDNFFVELNVENGVRGYFSCSTDMYRPISQERAIETERDSLLDLYSDGEIFESKAKEYVTRLDDGGFEIERSLKVKALEILERFDNSLCPIDFQYNDKTYIFESGSCGQVRHVHNDIQEYFIDPELHEQIFEAWDKHHVDENFRLDLELPEQDKRELLVEQSKKLIDEGVVR